MEFIRSEESSFRENKQETLNILAYSDIFQYPLTKKEIYERGKITMIELERCLDYLVRKQKIYLIDEFYTLHQDKLIAENRLKRNALAQKSMVKARSMAKKIACFPFVRGVFLSGSISKNCMDPSSDIDYFIITEPNRLWIVRLVCFIFRKTILLNKSKYFCTNFLLDTEHLAINEKSIYTAIEIKTLIPLVGYSYYIDMIKKNEWANIFFPKYPLHENNDVIKGKPFIQSALEKIVNNRFGDVLDKWFMEKTILRRKRKVNSKFLENPNFYINFQRYIAKDHTNEHYPMVIKEYSQKIKEYSL
ncbi:hypothetical protein GO730_35330 [Spirosoma sp. HMF3257]|uniref:Polymerase nucleotidyl transferase domain-containing protein n=1 Tax=Spirosoma telluris TaxID=2183553 RepID=A0A327NTK8_9BACT|nr:hypothetical protein [Spirosoma telluris]RAI78045.1 hypothetical protein HMF3257_35235 [Spirosoma telluris]